MFFGMRIFISGKKKKIGAINDYSCLKEKCSEFLYMPIDYVEAMVIRKGNFQEVMKTPFGKYLSKEIVSKYKYII